jgi:hypothetical protein
MYTSTVSKHHMVCALEIVHESIAEWSGQCSLGDKLMLHLGLEMVINISW